MIAFRKAHPSLGRSHFWRDDVRWHGIGACPTWPTTRTAWPTGCAAPAVGDDDLYVLINGYQEALLFHSCRRASPGDWWRVVDTGLESLDDIAEPGGEVAVTSMEYRVDARSVVVLIGETAGTAQG